jgi:topoisomerase IV subunit A
MRLRNLRKLEEMEIRTEDKDLRSERTELKKLLGSEKEQWKTVAGEIKKIRDTFGPKTKLGKRRTTFAEAPQHDEAAIEEAMVEREPITVVVSEKGWIRALRGTVTDLSGVTFKTDDSLKFAFPAETTSKILVFATNGRFYTLDGAKLPGGRGHGEPVRLFIDLEQTHELVAVFRHQGGRKFLPLEQVPEMTRGSGVRLQRYKDGSLSDVKTFKGADGLTWIDGGGRTFNLTLKELAAWRGNRSDAGRVRPDRFLTNNKFGGTVGGNGNGKNGGKD